MTPSEPEELVTGDNALKALAHVRRQRVLFLIFGFGVGVVLGAWLAYQWFRSITFCV